VAFTLLYVAIASWNLAQFPALQAGLPTASETAGGVVLALAAGLTGGLIGRGIGSWTAALAPDPREV
jgi:hypothetical protein